MNNPKIQYPLKNRKSVPEEHDRILILRIQYLIIQINILWESVN